MAKEELGDKMRESCVAMCSVFHSESSKLAVRFKNELKRFYYATPTSFLELIQTLKIVLGARRKALSGPSLNFYGVLMVDDLTDFG